MVIAAHPDDEVLGCGGTAARLVHEQHEVHFAILGEGITSRLAQRSDADAKQLNILHAQARAAAAKLGVKSVLMHQLPDNRLDAMPLLE
ncbi:MAG: PIG-L family deacetylase, partial [Candidatus Sulfotelmatobacter sp.]